jgi:hypothetical protein
MHIPSTNAQQQQELHIQTQGSKWVVAITLFFPSADFSGALKK